MNKILHIALLSLISAFCLKDLHAQAPAPVQVAFSHQFRNADSSNRSVAVSRWFARGGVPILKSPKSIFALGFSYAIDHYNFSNTTANWDTVHHANLGVAYRQKLNDKWLWGNYASFGLSAEEGADKSDSFIFNYISIAEYKLNDKLTLGAGFGLSSKIDRDLSLFPIIAIQWKINDEWTLSSGPSDVAPVGANVYTQYTPKGLNNKWVFTSGLSFSSKIFRLAERQPGGSTDLSGEEQLISAYLVASYKATDNIKLNLTAGYHLQQEFSTFDTQGNELSDESLSSPPFLGFSISYQF